MQFIWSKVVPLFIVGTCCYASMCKINLFNIANTMCNDRKDPTLQWNVVPVVMTYELLLWVLSCTAMYWTSFEQNVYYQTKKRDDSKYIWTNQRFK